MPRPSMVSLIALLAAVSACTSARSAPPATSQAQALARVEQLIRDTTAALTPVPRLDLIPYSVPPNPCAFSNDGMPERFTVNRKYWLRDVPKAEIASIARQVMTFWQQQGHAITSTGGFEVGHPSVGGKSRPDGYTLALVWAEGDNLYLAATSPCVK